ncbi:MAG: NADH/ubiquinone/plastoquinone (complex I) [Rhodospirillales bacterium]|nr:NADH/ubiquinone/plastoquinone (complex I) [Rhodospirillales bacterium]
MSALLAAGLITPLVLLAACLRPAWRQGVPAWLAVAPLPALAAALVVLGGAPLSLELPGLRLGVALDLPGALLLGVSAVLWSAAGLYAAAFLQRTTARLRFTVCWLLTLTGSLGVFMADDLIGFYLLFALASLPAYGLIAHDDNAEVWRAGAVYIAFTVLSEAFLLTGFVLLAAGEPLGSIQIRDVMAALPQSPWRDGALVLTAMGFVLKVGLVPTHGWMPLAYAAAPIPAAAVLSGAGVKAGVIGFLRFLPFDTAVPMAGELLVVFGLFSAFYGVLIGLLQSRPAVVLAYSSISQMGVIAAVLGMGLAVGDGGTVMAGAFYAAHHVLAKGALFLAIGVIAMTPAPRTRPTLLLAAVVALGLGGLPLTGGALAKLAVKGPLGDGLVGTLANASAAGTTLLMAHFLVWLARSAAREPPPGAALAFLLPWRFTALAAIFVPWLLYLEGGGGIGGVLAPDALWDTAWPVALGAALAIVWVRWGSGVPRLPVGDVIGAIERAFRATYAIGAAVERLDGVLRQWSSAALPLVAIAIVLSAAMTP